MDLQEGLSPNLSMTKLITTYARSTGLKIDPKGPNVKEVFYPLPFEKYITIQTGSAQAAKCYDLWQEVVALLLPILQANKVTLVHLGAKDDTPINGTFDLRGKTSILQSNYLVRRTLLHLGNDSWLAHCAGWWRRPLVALYGSTSSWNHGPYWMDPEKTVLLDAHRGGGTPTYASNEQPKTVNLIDPFRVADHALRLLGIQQIFPQQARFWGMLYQHVILDWIPDTVPSPQFLPHLPLTARMDLNHNEDTLIKTLQTGRKVNIMTNKPVNPGIISAFKGQILSYNHELGVPDTELPSIEYVGTIKSLCARHAWYTREADESKLASIRLPYFPDVCMVEQIKDTTKADYLSATLLYLNQEDTPENRLALEGELDYLRFRTNKFLLSEGSVYQSIIHKRLGKSLANLNENDGPMIDDPLLWRELNHLSIWYERPSKSSDVSS